MPDPDYVALQYYNKQVNLQPFACAHNFNNRADHQEALLNYSENQLLQLIDSKDVTNSHLRATVLLHLRDEILATYQLLRKVLHRNYRPFSPKVSSDLQELCKQLTSKHETLRIQVINILNRRTYNQIPLKSEEIGNEKDIICGAVRVIWEAERPIRAYLQPLIRER